MQRIVFYITVLFLSISGYAQGNKLFEAGNKFYNNGDFQKAINSYQSVLENNEHSGELYFNLANAYYKLNKIAPSIYYYEKALQLMPNDKEIESNLAFAQNMTIDDIESVPEIGLSRVFKNTVNALSFDTWAMIAVVLVFVFVILFLSYYFSYTTLKKRIAFLGSSSAIILAVLMLFFAFRKYDYDQKDKPAIVFAQESDVKTDPNLRSEIAFTLHEGTKVQILEFYNDNWTKVKLANGKTGWIPNEDIKAL